MGYKRKALKYLLNTPAKRYKQAWNVGSKIYSAYKGSSNSKKSIKAPGRDFGGVTSQHDARTIYRAKKMPYRKKKKWVQFTKKVAAVEISNRAKSTLLINTSTSLIIPADTQAWSESHLYSMKGTDVGCRDIDILLEDIQTYKRRVTPGNILTADGGKEVVNPNDNAFEDTRKELLFASGTIDNTYTNSGSVGIEMDLYTIIYKRQSTGTHGSFLSAVATNSNYVSPINVVSINDSVIASQIDLTSRGATLFDLPYGMSRTGAKILKKEKFFIAPGNSITKNVRDPKNHSYRMDTPDLVYQNKGYTQSYVACFKVVTNPLLDSGSMTLKSTRSYKYTYEGGATPYNRYVVETV